LSGKIICRIIKCSHQNHFGRRRFEITPINVGIREAKTNLSRLLKEVQKGAVVNITDRGKSIARLVPIEENAISMEQRISNMERNGWLNPLDHKQPVLPIPIPVPTNLAQQFLQEDRG